MTLVDTSIWIDHFRRGVPRLEAMLLDQDVLTHPFVIGEIACGRLARRNEILDHLQRLPQTAQASHEEALGLAERRGLEARRIGWVDVHLIASALLQGCFLWTNDQRLRRVAESLGIG